MNKALEAKVKELVADNKLAEALDTMINEEQHINQRKQNTLLLLKGKLAMLEEQQLAGMLDFEEVARQKAKIAHQVLDIADGSSLDIDIPTPKPEPSFVQSDKASSDRPMAPWLKYLLLAILLFAAGMAGMFFSKSFEVKPAETTETQTTQPTSNDETQQENQPSRPVADSEYKLVDFPKLNTAFNFSDLQYTFKRVTIEKYSDATADSPAKLKLTLKLEMICRSNLGNCYREEIRILAGEKPMAPDSRTNYAGWIAHNSTGEDEQGFIIEAGAKDYYIELSKDNSTWKRGFKIVKR